MKLSISLLQISFDFGEPAKNLDRVTKYIREAGKRGSDLALVPELWASGYDLSNWEQYATPLDSGMFKRVSELAKDNHLMIGCSLLELDKGAPYNTFVLYDKEGELISRYRKMHLFRLLKEEQYLGEGNEIVTVDTFWGKIGLSICYDLRFPEIYRALALRGSRLVLVVAEWPERRVNHWDILLRARAIENQVFIAAVNKVGESKGVKLGGHSVILDPWGKEIVYGSDHDILLTGELDMDEVNQARRWIPVFDDRRPGLYDLDS